jgi:hypothetical protein
MSAPESLDPATGWDLDRRPSRAPSLRTLHVAAVPIVLLFVWGPRAWMWAGWSLLTLYVGALALTTALHARALARLGSPDARESLALRRELFAIALLGGLVLTAGGVLLALHAERGLVRHGWQRAIVFSAAALNVGLFAAAFVLHRRARATLS